jgi:Asp-tRNA(Asn)/Glu-tRNA(Gln) amidotransferase C subunit
MAEDARPSRDDVRSLAGLTNLDLPDNRLDQLVTTMSAYLASLELLHQIEKGDSEPPVITYESEGPR